MKYDVNNLENLAVIQSDVVIVGAGPAGITCGHEWVNAGNTVNILESGGEKGEFDTQQLSGGELSGHLYEPLDATHVRQVGGTANHLILKLTDKQYGYRYTPLEAIDFEKRDYVANSGWPISKAELDPYYERVQHKCEIGPYNYTAKYWAKDDFELLPFQQNKAETSIFMFGPTRKFNHDFPQDIYRSPNVNIYTHATVTEIICGEDGESIEMVLVRTFEGKEVYFKAKYFILAANALQTPRLLLNSKRHHPNGIGNQYDNVGRYYMDHTLLASGNFVPHDLKYINKMRFYDMQGINGWSVLGRIMLTEEFKKQEKLLNFAAILFPMSWNPDDLNAMSSLQALKTHLRWHWKEKPKDLGKHLWNLVKGRKRLFRAIYERVHYGVPVLVGLGNGGWSRSNENEKKYGRLELLALVEQSPHRDNRVTLSEEKDALGCPKIKVHFEWPEAELDNYVKTQLHIGQALEDTGLGKYEPPKVPISTIKEAQGLHHMMGTTRMSDDPKFGVVDRNCKVFGISNLFVASSSTFTTGGFVNPTLTNIALAVRVADQVKSLLADGVVD